MDNKDNNNKKNPKKQTATILIVTGILAVLILFLFNRALNSGHTEEITYTEFINMVNEGVVDKVVVGTDEITITAHDPESGEKNITYYTGTLSDYQLAQRMLDAGVDVEQEIPDSTTSLILNVLVSFVLPFVIIWVLLSVVMRKMTNGGGMMGGFSKSNAKVYMEKETGVTFSDVAGQDEAKESLEEMVDFLHNPGKYTEIGARLPKGALLVGPPGCGKTLLAKAVAGEAHVPFFSLSGSAFVEMYVGVGASRVRDLFKQAQQMAPCIIFIDEIDAIGKSRETGMPGGNDEREQTLNQLLAEMDGFDSSKGLLILAATNRPEILDPALLRPGRFDRRVIVEKPDLKGRVDTLKVHSKNVHIDETVDFEAVALATGGATGSDLANMVNEAAILAVKHNRQVVCQKDFMDAMEIVLVGKEKKDRIMGEDERRIVSYHEVGHALLGALQKDSEPVQKITIVPRTMGALGYVLQTPDEEKFLNTKKELEAMLVGLLAGRAAEEIVFDTVTTGAANDIEKATALARAMVTQYGMSEEFGLIGLESVQHKYLDGRPVQNCGEATSAQIDGVVIRMLKDSYESAKTVLKEHRDTLDRIAAFLIEKETITGKEFMDIFKECEGLSDDELNERKASSCRITQYDKDNNAIPLSSEKKAADKASEDKEEDEGGVFIRDIWNTDAAENCTDAAGNCTDAAGNHTNAAGNCTDATGSCTDANME